MKRIMNKWGEGDSNSFSSKMETDIKSSVGHGVSSIPSAQVQPGLHGKTLSGCVRNGDTAQQRALPQESPPHRKQHCTSRSRSGTTGQAVSRGLRKINPALSSPLRGEAVSSTSRAKLHGSVNFPQGYGYPDPQTLSLPFLHNPLLPNTVSIYASNPLPSSRKDAGPGTTSTQCHFHLIQASHPGRRWGCCSQSPFGAF